MIALVALSFFDEDRSQLRWPRADVRRRIPEPFADSWHAKRVRPEPASIRQDRQLARLFHEIFGDASGDASLNFKTPFQRGAFHVRRRF